jgi:hypothetical protein
MNNIFLIIVLGLVIISFIIIFSDSAFASLGSLIVNPASTLDFKGTQYALSFNTTSTQQIKYLEVQFPPNTTISTGNFADIVVVNPNGSLISGTNQGKTTVSGDMGPTPKLKYEFTTPFIPASGTTDWFVLIIKVRNPIVTGNVTASLTVTTLNSSSLPIESASAIFGLQQLYNADNILAAINSKAGDICIGSGC